jgi:hypothetical protein
MIRTLLRLTAVVVVVGTMVAGRAHAEPLIVQQGGFSYEGDPFGWGLIGAGFSIGGGGSIPIVSVGNGCGSPCPPGKALNLSSVVGNGAPASLSNGSATIFGTTFDGILLGGILFFDAPTIVLPMPPPNQGEEDPIFFTSRFSFHGNVFGHTSGESGEPVDLLFNTELVGEGSVRLRALWQPQAGEYFTREVTYEFAPVPEPGTLLLLAAGTTLAGGRKWLVGRSKEPCQSTKAWPGLRGRPASRVTARTAAC